MASNVHRFFLIKMITWHTLKARTLQVDLNWDWIESPCFVASFCYQLLDSHSLVVQLLFYPWKTPGPPHLEGFSVTVPLNWNKKSHDISTKKIEIITLKVVYLASRWSNLVTRNSHEPGFVYSKSIREFITVCTTEAPKSSEISYIICKVNHLHITKKRFNSCLTYEFKI